MSDLQSDWFSERNNDHYGESHDWKRDDVVRNPTSHERFTPWRCAACGANFGHKYHVTPDIRKAMRQEGIQDKCEKSSVS